MRGSGHRRSSVDIWQLWKTFVAILRYTTRRVGRQNCFVWIPILVAIVTLREVLVRKTVVLSSLSGIDGDAVENHLFHCHLATKLMEAPS